MLEQKRISPVFQPSQEKSNFDAVYELEELLLEQAPLEGRARKAAKQKHHNKEVTPGVGAGIQGGTDVRRSKKDVGKRRNNRGDEEEKEEEVLEMINQYFEPYDYTRYFPWNQVVC